MSHKKIVVNMGDMYVKLAEIIVSRLSTEEKDAKLIRLLAGNYYQCDYSYNEALKKISNTKKEDISLFDNALEKIPKPSTKFPIKKHKLYNIKPCNNKQRHIISARKTISKIDKFFLNFKSIYSKSFVDSVNWWLQELHYCIEYGVDFTDDHKLAIKIMRSTMPKQLEKFQKETNCYLVERKEPISTISKSKHLESELCPKYLKANYKYDPKTGEVFGKKGEVIGSKNHEGYLVTSIKDIHGKKRSVKLHRVGWFLYYGKWPEQFLDHIDGNKSNNKISNLRDVSNQENIMNKTKPSWNDLGMSNIRLKKFAHGYEYICVLTQQEALDLNKGKPTYERRRRLRDIVLFRNKLFEKINREYNNIDRPDNQRFLDKFCSDLEKDTLAKKI